MARPKTTISTPHRGTAVADLADYVDDGVLSPAGALLGWLLGAIEGEPAPSDDWVKFIGAGSLMTALLVHVLWFKQQVDSVPLETIEY